MRLRDVALVVSLALDAVAEYHGSFTRILNAGIVGELFRLSGALEITWD